MPSLLSFDFLNNCVFPTVNDPEYIKWVRMRMWVAPNTMITFSNHNLPSTMGFLEHQIPAKSKKGQIEYTNIGTEKYRLWQGHSAPSFDVPTEKVKATKIHSYTANTTILSPTVNLTTIKKKERDPELLAADYSKVISALGKRMNVFMNLEYNAALKKFKVVYPTNPNISIRMFVPVQVLGQLGYDPSQGSSDCIAQTDTPDPVNPTVDTEDLEKKAKALVYDTGMLAVDVEEQTSHLSSHSGTFLMATLHPRDDGTLRNRVYLWDVPRVQVSNTNPDLRFVLYRFDDENRRLSLGWPVGAYVFGTLNGRV